MTQHSQNGEGVEVRARKVWAQTRAKHEASALGYTLEDSVIASMIAFAGESRQSLAREPATADVGREAKAWFKALPAYRFCAERDGQPAVLMTVADIEAFTAALSRAAPSSEGLNGKRIAEVMENDGGCWTPCSGCQEGVDGYVSEDDYPYSATFKCQPGGGCSECGGIGVLWQDGAYLASWGEDLPPSSEPAIAEGERAHRQTIDERDAAEAALSDAYRAVCGREPEWSNNFGYEDAVNEMREATTPATTNDAIPAGMVAHDGNGRPDDYDGGPAMQRNGKMARRVYDWGHYGADVVDGDTDIIAYTLKASATPSAPATEAVERNPVYGRDGEVEGSSVQFVNERGRTIRAAVIVRDNYVNIMVEGPDSISDNVVTHMEAAVIRDELIRAALATTPATTNDAIPAGMVAHDGNGRPDDYDGGPAMQRNGKMARRVYDWGHYGADVVDGDTDIIAYTLKASATPSAPATEVGEEA